MNEKKRTCILLKIIIKIYLILKISRHFLFEFDLNMVWLFFGKIQIKTPLDRAVKKINGPTPNLEMYPREHVNHPSLDDLLEDIIRESLHANLSVLIGGDLNRIISCSDHICCNLICRISLNSNILSKFLELGLVDVWRKKN